MRRDCLTWSEAAGRRSRSEGGVPVEAGLVLYFGERCALERPDLYEGLRRRRPLAAIAGCSTSGQILGADVSDGGAVAIAVKFMHTRTRLAGLDLPASCATRR